MKQFIKREFLILSVWLKLILRDRKKYLVVASSTYFLGAFVICKAAKPAYFFCRVIDDCVDGDSDPTSFGYKNVKDLIEKLKKILLNPDSADKPLEFLLLDLKRKAPEKSHPHLISFMDAMYAEFMRREERKIFTKDQLNSLHLESFLPVLELAFLSLETEYSEEMLLELALLQSLVYSIQDLDSDLKKGIINLPKELVLNLEITVDVFEKEPNFLWEDFHFLTWVEECLLEARRIGFSIMKLEKSPKAGRLISILVRPILTDIEILLLELEQKKQVQGIGMAKN